ncbi:zf-TFIIB domain-containing protein [bacterium]|nr:zf-TFIIB domain-containing protein [bacterium]
MRLVACPDCRTQYDVETLDGPSVSCRCGATVDAKPREAVDAKIERCASCGALVGPDADRCEYCTAVIVRDRLRLNLLCPGCYAANEENARFCAACGLEFAPQPLPGSMPELACMDCSEPLAVRAVGGVFVQECPKCRGLWAAAGAFEDLVDRAIAARREAKERFRAPKPRETSGNPVATQVKYRRCPVCRELMARRNFQHRSGVVVDRCNEHGIWLDENELEQIAGFILSGGMEKAQAAEAAQRQRTPTRATGEFTRLLMENQPPTPLAGTHTFLEFLRVALTRGF